MTQDGNKGEGEDRGIAAVLRRFDLASLRLFIAACEEKSIARAAEREFIASSTVSRRIADLEDAVGLPLLSRHQRGIAPTAAGETVLKYAREVCGSLERLHAELGELSSGARGRVRIVANISSIVQFLPEDIAAFGRVHPGVEIDLEKRLTAEVIRMVEDGEADIGICNDLADSGALLRSPYRSDTLALIAPRETAAPKGRKANEVFFADMLGRPFVGLEAGSALDAALSAQAAKAGRKLDTRIRVGSFDAACRMVHAGLGAAVVPRQVAELYADRLGIEVFGLKDAWASRDLILVSRPVDALPGPARTLLAFLAGAQG
ncbi:MAG: LysR substrate-binding domain-containing protein [Candidatus Protistobacter heckmanni]|nr:LysR substrate-binding domain-containing protein [Candidatus Protistobacter heckmanni]